MPSPEVARGLRYCARCPVPACAAAGIAAFCNETIVVLSPSTQNAMRNPKMYGWTACWSIVFFTVCYMTVGLAGNTLYTNSTCGVS